MIMNSTNDNLPTTRHSTKADVMGVRWLRAVASFILLKTKKGRDFFYITFVSFNIPNIAPIVSTAAPIFLAGVQTNVEPPLPSALLKLEVRAVLIVLTIVLYFTQFSKMYKMPITAFCAACGEFQTWFTELCRASKFLLHNVVRFNGTQFSKMYKMPITAFCAACGEFQTWFTELCRASKFFLQRVVILNRIKLKLWHKDTNYFVTFYKFAKFEKCGGFFVFNKIKFPITVTALCCGD
jgi:nitrate/TMAO reductase-like tetraheme cytochrome c subunit